jgi:sugar phosphate isomerase/epimerase
MNTRRDFVKIAGMGLLSMGAFPLMGKTESTPEVVKNRRKDLFNISVAGYTFRHYDLDTSLAIMQQLNLHYLCIKDFHLPLNSTSEAISAFHNKLADKQVVGHAVGPIYMKTEAEVDNAFEYARRVGVKIIVGVPNYELLPYVDKKVKEYNFNFAIHLHGPDIELYPTADDVMLHVGHLDPRIGLCLDIGHDTRAGFDPVADLKKYHKRVFDIHLNDVTAANKSGQLCELGRGIIDLPAFVNMLRKVKYSGACNIELTSGKEETIAALAESAGYIKGVMC